jgi:hypothetical protein
MDGFRGVSIDHREHDDGVDVFLVFHDLEGGELHLEWDFVLEALRLRSYDTEAYDFVWHAIDLLNDRQTAMEALDG